MSLLLAVLAALLQAIGALGQKQRLASRRRRLEVERAIVTSGGVLAAAARDPLWIAWGVFGLAGGLLGLQALAEIDLAVLKAVGKLQLAFVVIGGTWLLGERLRFAEWLAVGTMLCGGLVLALAGPAATGVGASDRAHQVVVLTTCGVVAVLAGVRRRWPERASPELLLALAAGTLFGTGDVLMQGATALAGGSDGAFHLLERGSLTALLGSPPFLASVPAYAGGLVLVQMAFSAGRASVVASVVAIGATLLPIGFGFLVLQEQGGPLRLAGIALLLVGAVLLVRRASPGSEPRAYA